MSSRFVGSGLRSIETGISFGGGQSGSGGDLESANEFELTA